MHFLVLGGVLVALHGLFGARAARTLIVDETVRRGLRQEHARRTGVLPSAEEERQLIQRYVDDEILYREALDLGLDRGDVIVRRRLLQKMEFLAEETSPIAEPTDADLAALLVEEGGRYAIEPRLGLTHVFVGSDRHGDRAEARARELAGQIHAGADPGKLGDPFARGRDIAPSTERELGSIFGAELAARAMGLPLNVWSEPIRSSYGFHLIRPTSRDAGREAVVADVRPRLRLDWIERKRGEQRQAALASLRERYEIDLSP